MNRKRNIKKQCSIKKEGKYGDYALVNGCLKSPVWKLIFTNFEKAFWMISKQWFLFVRGMFNFAFCCVFRKTAGINQSGLLISTATLFFFFSINCSEIWILFKGIGLFYIPISVFWKSYDEILDMLVTYINSTILLYYNFLLLITSIISVLKFYLGKTDQEDYSSRGTSRLYLFIKWVIKKSRNRKINVSKQFIESIVEPSLLILTSILLFSHDAYASVVFMLMAISEISIQVINKAVSIQIETFQRA